MKNKKEHLTKTGFQKIVNLRAALNTGELSKELKAAFPKTKRVKRPLVENQKIIDPQWLAGFSSAEGCFAIEISYSHKYKLGLNVKLKYQVSQHIRDEKLIKSLINYLKCGWCEVKTTKGEGICNLYVTKFSDIYEKIIPFFIKHPIVGVKSLDFADWCKAAEIIQTKTHLLKEGSDEIVKIKTAMNKGRY